MTDETERGLCLIPFQVWPLGNGMTISCAGNKDTAGNLWLFAVPDTMLRDDWKTTEPTVEQLQEIWEGDGPRCLLQFSDVETVERFIVGLEHVKLALAGGVQ